METQLKTVHGTFESMFQFQESIFSNALDGITESDALRVISPHSNHINWLVGHIVHCRYMLVNMLGVQQTNPFEDLYWKASEAQSFSTLSDISKEFFRISDLLKDALLNPLGDNSKATPEMISFFIYHEAYHLGQIGYLRKALGMGVMKSH